MNILRTVVLMTALTLLLVWAGGMLGGQSGALFALIIAGVMNLGSYWFSDKIVIRMYRGREVQSGPLYEVVAELCQRRPTPSLPVAIPSTLRLLPPRASCRSSAARN